MSLRPFYLLNGPLDLAIPYLIRITGDETQAGLILAVMNAGALAGGAAITLPLALRVWFLWTRLFGILNGFSVSRSVAAF